MAGRVDVRYATQPAPRGTVNAVLCASDYVGDAPYGVGNADDVYGQRRLRAAGRASARENGDTTRWSAIAWPTPSSASRPSPGASAGSADGGLLLGVDERRQVRATPAGGFVAGDGREPAELSSDARVSMNLWGFTPEFHKPLQAAMDAAVDASEEKEVLLPEVVAQSLGNSTFDVLAATGRCVGVTHADDLGLVQDELDRQVAAGERPAGLWAVPPLSNANIALGGGDGRHRR